MSVVVFDANHNIPFAFEFAVLLAASPRPHGMSTLIGSHTLAAEGNFKDEGYKIAVFMTENIGNNNDL
ncbi:hypothetical protein RINTU1_12310 [Candidatus Regiella insecticola]|uniref:Uncharacterized protein n=1 Tax=Candidatus Regiella insecticola TaxID=138073 RepID=A0A6L2ZM03_9ENTR|nr:hypothetical protein RINTU1_12310 [Candidatus Regiella insecticola]